MPTKMTLEWRDPRKLKNHPINLKIYGDQPDPEFVSKVKQHGVTTPLIVLPDETVIAGHRRRQAAIINKIEKVPVLVRRDLTDALDIEEAVILDNEQRVKTTEQRAREFEHLKHIEAERAKQRLATSTGGPNPRPRQNSDKAEKPRGKRRSDEVAAEKVGLSRDTARKAAAVVHEIDKAEANGHPDKAQELRETLNGKSVAAAHRKVQQNGKPTPSRVRKPTTAEIFKPLTDAIGKAARECDAVARKTGGQGVHHKKTLGALEKALEAAKAWKEDQ